MRLVGLAAWVLGCATLVAAGLAAATTVQLEFAEVNGEVVSAPPFPTLNIPQTTPPVAIPGGERVVAASISGYWGTIDYRDSTAPVDVFLDGILVAQCVAPDPCWVDDGSGQMPWNHLFTADELPLLKPGNPKLTVVQKDKTRVRLGKSTLVMETAPAQVVANPAPAVPTLSPLGLLALLAATAAAGAFALRRHPRV